MGYYSNVAFSFTKNNWKNLLDAIKHQNEEFQKEANWLIKNADIGQDHPDGKHHILYWNYVKWYEHDPDSIGVVKFFEHEGRQLANEYMRIGEESGDFEYDGAEDDEGMFMRDGDEIYIEGINLSNYQKNKMLRELVSAFMSVAPGAATTWYRNHKKDYGCGEYDVLFGKG